MTHESKHEPTENDIQLNVVHLFVICRIMSELSSGLKLKIEQSTAIAMPSHLKILITIPFYCHPIRILTRIFFSEIFFGISKNI